MNNLVLTPLLEAIREKQCLLVIGAGFSLNADSATGKQMPDWKRLTELLATELKTKETDPLKIAEQYDKIFGRTTLLETLARELLVGKVSPGHVHRHLIRMSFFDVICTTNFDNLLEDACRQEGKSFRVIIDKNQLALYGSSQDMKIIKMHSDFSIPDRIIVTEKDYSGYEAIFQHLVIYLSSLLMTKTPLFLGFSLKDPNFVQIKHMIEKVMGNSTRKGYIVLFDPNEKEKTEYEKMNLIVIPLITNDRSRSDTLLEFISMFDQSSKITSPKASLAVKANKAILFHDQTIEIRTLSHKIDSRKTSIKITDSKNEIVFNGSMDNAETIDEFILSTKIKLSGSEWKGGEKYTITAVNGDLSITDSFRLAEPLEIVAQTDKSVYLYNSKIVVTIIVPQAVLGSKINFKILNEENNPIYSDFIMVETERNGLYQKIIQIQGEEWKKRGRQFRLIAEYKSKNASVTIYRSNFGTAIELDQKVYSWSDRVSVTIVAPDLNRDSNVIEFIGKDSDNLITISTSKGKIIGYKLVETGPDTGIFVGKLKLTGFPGHQVASLTNRNYPFGITRGFGPNDGLIASSDYDKITVSLKFSDNEIIEGTAMIRWNIGSIQWLEPRYTLGSIGVIRIVDPDMNLNPDLIDNFPIHVWSDSDKEGMDIIVYETGTNSGIFEGTVLFEVGDSMSGKLRVKKGDSVTAQYVDNTLPTPYTINNSLKLTSTISIEN